MASSLADVATTALQQVGHAGDVVAAESREHDTPMAQKSDCVPASKVHSFEILCTSLNRTSPNSLACLSLVAYEKRSRTQDMIPIGKMCQATWGWQGSSQESPEFGYSDT